MRALWCIAAGISFVREGLARGGERGRSRSILVCSALSFACAWELAIAQSAPELKTHQFYVPPTSPKSAAPPSNRTLDAREARGNIGKQAIVRCNLVQVSESGRGNKFLNCEAPFPSQPFYAVIFQSNLPQFQNLDALRGRIVFFEGLIEDYKGRASMVVSHPNQIRFGP